MTQAFFDETVYETRRSVLSSALGKGVILLAGNRESAINYAANPYPFRQDSTFLYYCGIDLPGLALIVDIDNGKTILYGDEQTATDIVWSGARERLASLAGRAGISEVRPAVALIGDYAQCDIHCLPPYRAEHFRLLQEINQYADCSVAPSSLLIRAVIAQREIKTDDEVAQIEQALQVTALMHTTVMQTVRPRMREAVLKGIAAGIASAHDVRLPYGIILTREGQVLHKTTYRNVLRNGDLILGDFGAESRMGYASDITRTFPVSRTFNDRQKEIYTLVLTAQQQAIDAARPGVLFRELHMQAARVIAEGLNALGLMQGDTDEAVAAGAHALFYPHGLGHMLGLDVHDMEGLGEDRVGYDDAVSRSDQFGLAYLRMAKALKSGHVVTVEPGIYFIPELIDQWKTEGRHTSFINYEALDAYRKFGGVRIEDNVLVTQDGCRVLGPEITKTVAAIEELRKG